MRCDSGRNEDQSLSTRAHFKRKFLFPRCFAHRKPTLERFVFQLLIDSQTVRVKRYFMSQNPALVVQRARDILWPFGQDGDLPRRGLQLAERVAKNARKRAVAAWQMVTFGFRNPNTVTISDFVVVNPLALDGRTSRDAGGPILSERPVARCFRDKLMCIQGATLVSSSPGFPTPACDREVVHTRPRSGSENEGHMNFTLRTKKNILSVATTAVFLLGIGRSTPANDQRRTTSVNRPSGITTVGKIEIPAVGLATRVLEGSNASTLRVAVGHIPGTALPGPSGNVGLAGHRNTFFRSLRYIRAGDEIRFSTAAGTFNIELFLLALFSPTPSKS
jgi:Sortase domain